MYVVKELQLNKFQPVNIPSGKELFKRYGVSLGLSYSGDEEAPMPESKIDQISNASKLNDRELAKEAKAAEKAARVAAAAQQDTAAAQAAGKVPEPSPASKSE